MQNCSERFGPGCSDRESPSIIQAFNYLSEQTAVLPRMEEPFAGITFMSNLAGPFHLAIPVKDLSSARAFYGELFQCAEGRCAERWVDFNFYGHQLVCHVANDYPSSKATDPDSNPVDGHDVPIPHFGVVLSMTDWNELAEKLKSAGTKFIIEPYVRFAGQPGEQATMFLYDPSGNALEFKAFADPGQLFAK